MGFKRNLGPPPPLVGEALTAAMVGIGMNFAAAPAPNANIEDTLIAASIAGVEGEDYRILSVLVTWLGVHSTWINADRMSALASKQRFERVRAFWSAIGTGLAKDRRFARMARIYSGPRVDLPVPGIEFLVQRSGEDPRLAQGPLRVPNGLLRDRPSDVLTPAQLARQHMAYRRRIQLGPSYRADMWAELERDASISAAELARRTYGSFATAWRVKHDWQVLEAAMAT